MSERVRRVMRILVAPPRQGEPEHVEDIIKMGEGEDRYEPHGLWRDMASTKVGFVQQKGKITTQITADGANARLLAQMARRSIGEPPFLLVFLWQDPRTNEVGGYLFTKAMMQKFTGPTGVGDRGVYSVEFATGQPKEITQDPLLA